MPSQFTSITRKDLARGMDTFSPKGSIPDGYSQLLQNIDTNASGKLTTRQGYEGYYGWVPFRVASISHNDTEIRLQFADNVNLSLEHQGPLVVYGILSSVQTGDFSTSPMAHYYPSYSIDSKVTLTAPSGTVTQTALQNGFDTSDFWAGLTEATSVTNLSNQIVIPDDVRIDTADFSVEIDYTIPSNRQAYVYYADAAAVSGTVYRTSVTQASAAFTAVAATDVITSAGHGLSDYEYVMVTTSGTLPGGLVAGQLYAVQAATLNTFKLAVHNTDGTYTLVDITTAGTGTQTWHQRGWLVSAVTHGLNNIQVVAKAFDTVTTLNKAIEVIPAEWILSVAGDVTSVFESDFTGDLVLQSAPTANRQTATAVTGSNTVTITGMTTPFVFPMIYRIDDAGDFGSVIVDSLSYDAPTETMTIDYTLAGPSELVEIYWIEARIVANAIVLEDTGSVSTTYTDNAPQLTVWGLDQEVAYPGREDQAGHVTHLDSYKRSGEARVVCGLGGNLFKAGDYETYAGDYLMGSWAVSANTRLTGAKLLAPLFWDADPGVVRTRGVVYDTTVSSDNRAVVTAATYISSGVVDYTLSFASKSTNLVVGGNISTFDLLTVSGLANPQHTGSWEIISVNTQSGTAVNVRVSNTNITSARFDEIGALGRAGMFTDRLTVSTSSIALGSTLISDSIPADVTLTVIAANLTIFVSGVTEPIDFPNNVRINGSRAAATTFVLRDDVNVETAEDIVRGDMLRISALDRRTRVLGARHQDSQTMTITNGTGDTKVITVPDPHGFNVDDVALFIGMDDVGGEFTVTAINSDVEFEIEFDLDGATTGTLAGHTITVDEALTVQDGADATVFTVDGRWLPIEAPTTAFDLPATTHFRYFDANDYTEQSALKSTIINDSMFLTNGDDEVFKFDGESLFRAGFPRWQPGLFVSDLSTGSLASGLTVAYSAKSTAGKYFTVATSTLKAGDSVQETSTGLVFLVTEVVFNDTTSDYQVVISNQGDIASTPASGTLKKVLVYKYYARLNMIDANQSIVAGYAAQSEDLVFNYGQTGQIRLRMVGMPAFGPYDFDRIELEVYRTEANGSTFNLQSRRLLDFDQADGYLDIIDSLDDTLLAGHPDVVMSALLGPELGTTWDQPPRASAITSLNNRLMLGNIKSYPEVDITLKPATANGSITVNDVAGQRWLFRKDSTDTDTDTDMTNRAAYEFIINSDGPFDPTTTIGNFTASTFTVSITANGYVAGDWIYLFHNNPGTDNDLTFAGWWQVHEVLSANDFTVLFNNTRVGSGTLDDVNRIVSATDPKDIPVYVGIDGNYNQREGNRVGTDTELQIMTRFAAAIDASMRLVDKTLTAFEDFQPWLMANAGNDYAAGQAVVTSPLVAANLPEVVLPAVTADVQVFVNGSKYGDDDEVAFIVKVFPARLLRSYTNFPEIFDFPFAATADQSDSIIDVNPADGQEIVAIIPFFGDSATGVSGAPLNQECVVFKTNSIYLVNPETKLIQKIDSRGMGCTAPASVAHTKDGINFANASGMFRLGRDMAVTPVGLNMTGVWRREVDQTQLASATGHHYAIGRRYKLSVPIKGTNYNSLVLVYDYDREGQGQVFGAWVEYTNHPTTGWCNLEDQAFWSSTHGDVFLVRNRSASLEASDVASDYRDEAAAVDEQVVVLRAEDFDVPAVRKVTAYVTSLFELDTTSLSELQLYVAQNLSGDFVLMNSGVGANIATTPQLLFRASPGERRGTSIQVKYAHEVKDEQMSLTGVAYHTGLLTPKLTKEGADVS